jgi:hypothetical protein
MISIQHFNTVKSYNVQKVLSSEYKNFANMNDNPSKKLTVTAVSHPDGIITAFPNELPHLIVQGNSMDDIAKKMQALLNWYSVRLQKSSNNLDIKEQHI